MRSLGTVLDCPAVLGITGVRHRESLARDDLEGSELKGRVGKSDGRRAVNVPVRVHHQLSVPWVGHDELVESSVGRDTVDNLLRGGSTDEKADNRRKHGEKTQFVRELRSRIHFPSPG